MKMKKFFILVVIFYSNIFIYSQDKCAAKDSVIFNYHIFAEDHFIFASIDNQKSRYTPTKEEVLKAEIILNKNVDYLRVCQMKQNGLPPYIHINLNHYDRQYFGFLNKEGEKIVLINFFWHNRFSFAELSEDYIYMLGGGSYYWSTFVNITKETLFKTRINGIS